MSEFMKRVHLLNLSASSQGSVHGMLVSVGVCCSISTFVSMCCGRVQVSEFMEMSSSFELVWEFTRFSSRYAVGRHLLH
jgi:hypothetical protein